MGWSPCEFGVCLYWRAKTKRKKQPRYELGIWNKKMDRIGVICMCNYGNPQANCLWIAQNTGDYAIKMHNKNNCGLTENSIAIIIWIGIVLVCDWISASRFAWLIHNPTIFTCTRSFERTLLRLCCVFFFISVIRSVDFEYKTVSMIYKSHTMCAD